MERDLFGRLLGIALKEKLDLKKVLSYPLTNVPLSLCHFDGSICKTDQTAMLKILQKKGTTNELHNVEIGIIDGFLLFDLLLDVPQTFGKISKKLLQMVTGYEGKEIIVVFDQYSSPSIRDYEFQSQGILRKSKYNISGAEQKRPSNFSKELKNIYFREAIVEFLLEDWSADSMVPFIGDKIVYVNYEFCYSYRVESGKLIRKIENDLSCSDHIELNTKIVYHVCQIEEKSNILIRSPSTEILIIMLGNMTNLKNPEHEISLHVGTKTVQFSFNISELYEKLGSDLCLSLPGFHAFTGYDNNPTFFRKGKQKPFKMLENSKKFQKVFSDLGDSEIRDEQITFPTIEEFVCKIYNEKSLKDVNEARLAIFTKNFEVKKIDDTFCKKVESFNASSLPPCKTELQQHLLRSTYISKVWRNAFLQKPTDWDAKRFGWNELDNKLHFEWFAGDQVPHFIHEVILQPEENNDTGLY